MKMLCKLFGHKWFKNGRIASNIFEANKNFFDARISEANKYAERLMNVATQFDSINKKQAHRIAALERQRNDLHQTTNRYQERYRAAENALREILNCSDSEMRDGDFARDKAAEVLHVTPY